jgi:DNA uptake protein ComE-like DNA-binding protein
MNSYRVLLGALTVALLSAPAFAQDTKPSTLPAPKVTAPMAAPMDAHKDLPKTTGAATAPVTTKINLNTASETELSKLPKVSPVQSKAIVDARAKSKFKSYDDFVGRKLVPADTAAAIKDSVSF